MRSLPAYRRTIRAMSRDSEIVLEDKDGEIEQTTLEEDLPYDMNADGDPDQTGGTMGSGILTVWISRSATRERQWNLPPWS